MWSKKSQNAYAEVARTDRGVCFCYKWEKNGRFERKGIFNCKSRTDLQNGFEGRIDRQDMFVFAHFVKIYLEKENAD